jgi:hypothetical protein
MLDTGGGPFIVQNKVPKRPLIPDGTLGKSHLSAIRPNPFRRSTTIAYQLTNASAVELSVYDVAGRLIRTVQATTQPAGAYAVTWDGRDVAGRHVAAGTYFVRLTAGDVTPTRKVVFLGGQ